MNILITGGAGFIGTNLALRLAKTSSKIIIVDNLITGSKKNFQLLSSIPTINCVIHDIVKPVPKKLFQEKIDQIYHLACPTGVPNIAKLGEEMLLTCSIGTKNILDLAVKHKARLLFTSSSEIYGDPLIFPQKESYTGNVDPTGERSAYEEGKRFGESLTVEYVRKNQLAAMIVRVFNTYGPFMTTSDQRVIPRFLFQAIKGQPVTIHGDGSQKRTFCFVDDTVDGLICVMNKGEAGQVYNLGTDAEISIKELAQMVLKISGNKSKIQYVARPKHDHSRRLPAVDKIRKLGWRDKITLYQGLRLTLSSIKPD